MNRFLLKAVFIISTFILFNSAAALAQTVKGVVRDSETGEPLAGVVVMFERVVDDPTANMTGTQTEADGSYILQIPEGIEGVLGLYFISYDDLKSQVIKLGKGDELTLDLNMTFQSETLETAVIVARKDPESVGALINDRKVSAQAVENIGAAEISAKGLSNVAEAVETMSGVSFNSSGQLFVRGLGDRYSLTTLNGLPVASPNPDNKLIPLDIFSSSVLQNITVTKVYTATSFADYSGAHIDIATKENIEDSFLSVSLGLNGTIGTTFTDTYRPDRNGWLLHDNNLPRNVREMSLPATPSAPRSTSASRWPCPTSPARYPEDAPSVSGTETSSASWPPPPYPPAARTSTTPTSPTSIHRASTWTSSPTTLTNTVLT